MPNLFDDGYSAQVRPMLIGRRGAIATANPLATSAGQLMFEKGGNAIDATIAAQAVLCVIAPEACGLGGDMLALVDEPGAGPVAVTGAGLSPNGLQEASQDGANSITVPGIVSSWVSMSSRWGALPLTAVLAPAIDIATNGLILSSALAVAVETHRARLLAGGANDWLLLKTPAGGRLMQPELARLLLAIADNGAPAFYKGPSAAAIVTAVKALGGTLGIGDLADHQTEFSKPIVVKFGTWHVAVQPPPTQGVLLAMALAALEQHPTSEAGLLDHLCVELTEAAFEYRSRAADDETLLNVSLTVDQARAARRGGPRAYLHTAGVAAADADGRTVSSLVSVFDDFGSCVFVPELGITLNNRAGGFTEGLNAPGPGKRPVHTLAPALLSDGMRRIAIATPGADGQVQTLLQILSKLTRQGMSLPKAVAAARWRSEGGELLIEADHPNRDALEHLGHHLRQLPPGDTRFGAIVCAAFDRAPAALADWRRECWAGVA